MRYTTTFQEGMLVRYIGIMLDRNIINRNTKGKKTYERLQYYAKAAKELQVTPVFFHPTDANLKLKKCKGYLWKHNKLISTTVPLPAIIHNRVLSGNKLMKKKLKELSKISNVYNGVVTRDKWKVHQVLCKESALKPYLPKTALYSKANLTTFLERYNVIYVKPTIGSIGKGVLRIEKTGEEYRLFASRLQRTLKADQLFMYVKNWVESKSSRFIIQQGIPLSEYNGRTFDIRVSIQKNNMQNWTISGMVAKVAHRKNKLSNLAQGGNAVKIDTVLTKIFPKQQLLAHLVALAHVSLSIAKALENFQPSLADLGLDLGIDPNGHPYFIEANVRDQRYSFFKAREAEMFYQTYASPIQYGVNMLQNEMQTKSAKD
ncbi:YheC/YheD family endospore coat-associated protein [Brevibacillus daliensis]|uniref:YheC/YheD family endospore coat-associated protein n=1 Tax=Brevibacillus daliensis TaxID=2892995 RepID=UPI001E479C16|nr:YheC/YheD family protein [Brevibacillus daliensis]